MSDKENKQKQIKAENEIPKEELKHVNGGIREVVVDETPGDAGKSPYFV